MRDDVRQHFVQAKLKSLGQRLRDIMLTTGRDEPCRRAPHFRTVDAISANGKFVMP